MSKGRETYIEISSDFCPNIRSKVDGLKLMVFYRFGSISERLEPKFGQNYANRFDLWRETG